MMTNYRILYKTKSTEAVNRIKFLEGETDKQAYIIGEQKKQLAELQEKLDAAATGQQYQGDGAEAMQEEIKRLKLDLEIEQGICKLLRQDKERLDEVAKTCVQASNTTIDKLTGQVAGLEKAIELMTRREENK